MANFNKYNNCSKYRFNSIFPAPLSGSFPATATVITGFGEPLQIQGKIGDIYIDLSTQKIYEKREVPSPPVPQIRTLPAPSIEYTELNPPSSITDDASPEIQSSINNITEDNSTIILNSGTYNIKTVLNVLPQNKKNNNGIINLIIEGKGINSTILSSDNLVNILNVTGDNVTIKDLSIVHNFNQHGSANNEAAILINNTSASQIYIDNCEFWISEFAISSNASQIQVTNCIFRPNDDPMLLTNRYAAIFMVNSNADTIISNNTIITDKRTAASGSASILRISSVLGSTPLSGRLLLKENIQSSLSTTNLRHILLLENSNIDLLELFIIGNSSFLEGNAPILFPNLNVDDFSFLQLENNSIKNTRGKGLLAFYLGYTSPNNTSTNTNISLINNEIENKTFSSPWISATTPSTFDIGVDENFPHSPLLHFSLESYWYDTGQIVSR